MRVEADTDVRALRRIALLVRRAREDWGGECPELNGIAAVIERMKRDIVLGKQLVGTDLRRMASLVGGLSCRAAATSRLNQLVVGELRDLVSHMVPARM